jgi:hypothetical protein
MARLAIRNVSFQLPNYLCSPTTKPVPGRERLWVKHEQYGGNPPQDHAGHLGRGLILLAKGEDYSEEPGTKVTLAFILLAESPLENLLQ